MMTKKATATKQTDEQRAAALAEAHDMIVKAVSEITSDTDWRRWLDTLSKFHTYSFNNVILLHMQCAAREMAPPTRVAGFKTWLSLNRGVRRGERALKVYAPLIVKIKEGERGYPGTKCVGFRLVPTFDIQQTDGEPLPEPPSPDVPDGEAPAGLWDSLVTFASERGYHVRVGPAWGNSEGHTDPIMHEIVISNKIDSSARRAAILAHEIAHMLLHTEDDYDYRGHRGVAETEAESVAYLVSRHFGINMGNSSFHYVAGWAKDADTVMRVGQRVQSTAKKIIEAVTLV